MGLITALKSFGQRTITGQNVLGKSLDTLSGVFSHPVTAVTKGVGAATEQMLKESKTQRALSTLTATAGYVSVVAGAGALTGATKAGTLGGVVTTGIKKAITGISKAVGKSFVSHPISTTAAVLLGAPMVAGVIKAKPEIITSLPAKSFKGGEKLVEVIEENPVAAAVVGGIPAGVAAYELSKEYLGGDETKVLLEQGGAKVTD